MPLRHGNGKQESAAYVIIDAPNNGIHIGPCTVEESAAMEGFLNIWVDGVLMYSAHSTRVIIQWETHQ